MKIQRVRSYKRSTKDITKMISFLREEAAAAEKIASKTPAEKVKEHEFLSDYINDQTMLGNILCWVLGGPDIFRR